MFYINAESDIQDLSYIIGLNSLRFDEGVSVYQIFQKKKWNETGNLDSTLLSQERQTGINNGNEEEMIVRHIRDVELMGLTGSGMWKNGEG